MTEGHPHLIKLGMDLSKYKKEAINDSLSIYNMKVKVSLIHWPEKNMIFLDK